VALVIGLTDFFHSKDEILALSYTCVGFFDGRIAKKGRFGPFLLYTNDVRHTNATFLPLRVRTLGGEIDVVAEPALVNGPVRVGNVVTCSCWLSGRRQRLGQWARNGRRDGN
jgi:hypothetical protein